MAQELLQILLIEDNPGDAILVQEMLFDAEGAPFTLHRAESLLEGLDKLVQMDMDAVLLDLNLPDSQGLETFTTLKTHAPGIPIVLLTGNDNESLAFSAVEAGAQDYLVKDKLNGEALVRALRYAVVRHHNTPEQSSSVSESGGGRMVGLLGAKGGVGTTTVACHMAVELRRQTGEPVLLADLDMDAGAVGFLMQAKSPYSILEAAENVHHLDLSFWKTLVSRICDGLDVLPSPGLHGAKEDLMANRVAHALRFARKYYAWIVLDLGLLNALSRRLLKDLNELLLVTTSDIVCVYEAGRVVESLLNHGFDKDFLSLVQNKAVKWSAAPNVLKAVVEAPVRAALPACKDELSEAYTKGKLLSNKSKFRKDLAALVASMAGVPHNEGTAGFSLRRFSLFGSREPSHAGQMET